MIDVFLVLIQPHLILILINIISLQPFTWYRLIQARKGGLIWEFRW